MSRGVTVRANFETAHRLPFLGGKCTNLHGHSWWATVTVETPDQTVGVVVEFGAFKKALREWIDDHLDHGVMLGEEDPLATVLPSYGKTFVFDRSMGGWPTVENVARLIADRATAALAGMERSPYCTVTHVHVQETHVNGATWTP